MWSLLGASLDLVHALLMAAWVIGLPLLFWRRPPGAARAYGVYAIAFIVVSQGSHLALGECFLTALARACWQHASLSGASAGVPDEWFTVRLSQAIFRLTPSHQSIKLVSEALILVTSIGVLVSLGAFGRSSRRAHAGSGTLFAGSSAVLETKSHVNGRECPLARFGEAADDN
jgi:hypothetical protein